MLTGPQVHKASLEPMARMAQQALPALKVPHGAQGLQGIQGLTGPAGLMCWDLNANGLADLRRKILMAILLLMHLIVPAHRA